MLARRRILGAAVILAGILVVTIVALRPDPFADTRAVWVEFDSVQGLGSIDRDVRVAGVNVGTIGEVEREGDDARVELVLEESAIEVREDAFAELRPHTLFEGTAFVDLSPGSPLADPLPDGGTIPRSHSSVYVSLDSALRILRKPTRESLRQIIRDASATVRGEAIPGVQRTLKGAPPLTADVAAGARALTGPRGVELAGAVEGLSKTVDDLAANEEQLGALAGRAQSTFAALNTQSGRPLDRTLRALPGALEQLRRTGPSLTETLAALEVVSANARPALPDLEAALTGAPGLLDRANPILRGARPLIGDTATVLARLDAAAPGLRRLVNEYLPSADLFNSSILPYLHRDSRLGVPAYVQLLSAFTAGTGAFSPYQTAAQNPLGEGHLVRLGAYFDPAGLAGVGTPSCSVIEQFSPEGAAQLAAVGLCAP